MRSSWVWTLFLFPLHTMLSWDTHFEYKLWLSLDLPLARVCLREWTVFRFWHTDVHLECNALTSALA